MEQNKIICPNCGAENEYAGNCLYCGSPLTNADSETPVVEQLDGGIKSVDDKYHMLERTYDKFNKLTEYRIKHSLYYPNNNTGPIMKISDLSIIKKCYPEREEYYLRCKNEKYSIRTMELLIDQKKKISISPSDWVRGYQAKWDGNFEFKITKNTLYEICQAHSIEGRILYSNDEKSLVIGDLVKTSCLFYHLLCDNTQFVDIYNEVVKRIEEEKRKREEEEKQEIENKRKWRLEQIELEKRMKRDDTISLIAIYVSIAFYILYFLFLVLTIITSINKDNDSLLTTYAIITIICLLGGLLANAIYKKYSD